MTEDRRKSGAERPNHSNRSGGGQSKAHSQGSSRGGDSERGGNRSSSKGDWTKGGKKFSDKKFDGRKPREKSRGADTQRSGRPEGRAEARDEMRTHNPGDLRSSNRPDRPRSPDIDDDVTGKELDRAARAELRYLQEPNGTWVSKHLVMAGRLVDLEPETSYQHAMAASRRGGRIAVVREAVGLTAYAAGHFADALREFRTFRRISGSNVHLPMMADCERALGRPEKALELAHSEDAQKLDTPVKVEMAIIASGAQADLGNLEAALAELEIPQLDRNRAYSFSPRLFSVYAEALSDLGRDDEAQEWLNRVTVAEQALGIGEFADPEIVDFDDEEDEQARKPRVKDVLEDATQGAAPEPVAPAAPQESVGVDEEDGLNVVESSDAPEDASAQDDVTDPTSNEDR